MIDRRDDEEWSPLDSGAAPMPPVLGAGCASRFDPHSLNEQSGVDYSPSLPADETAPDIAH